MVPTLDETERMWSRIEDAWAAQGAAAVAARDALTARRPGEELPDARATVEGALAGVIAHLRAGFADDACTADELVAMDRVLERALYTIDRADIQAVTDGSDDGFLYARGFIVALGKAFYAAVLANPDLALPDAECEDMCYLPAHVHDARFGGFPDTGSDLSRESGSNAEGWPALAGEIEVE